jgi:hypothetical protein
MRNNKQAKQNRYRRNNGRKSLLHNPQNQDQQQNISASRRIFKIKDVKVPRKYFYNTGYQQAMVSGGNIVALAQITQGTQSDQRVGNKVVLRKLEMKYVIASPPSDAYNQVRILVIYAPNTNITLPQMLDTNSGSGVIDPLSFPNAYATGTTFTILYDQTHICNVSSSNSAVHGEIMIPINLPSSWNYNQNFESGYLSLAWIGDSNFTPHPLFTYNIRTFFTDL